MQLPPLPPGDLPYPLLHPWIASCPMVVEQSGRDQIWESLAGAASACQCELNELWTLLYKLQRPCTFKSAGVNALINMLIKNFVADPWQSLNHCVYVFLNQMDDNLCINFIQLHEIIHITKLLLSYAPPGVIINYIHYVCVCVYI